MLDADRIAVDSSPAAIAEGPNLQLWVGPSQVPDEKTETLKEYLSDQESCSVNQGASTQYTSETSSKAMDSVTTANSVFGLGRTLLNHTTTGCIGANETKPYSLASDNGP